jgi:autotransporter-associated beta strand protein
LNVDVPELEASRCEGIRGRARAGSVAGLLLGIKFGVAFFHDVAEFGFAGFDGVGVGGVDVVFEVEEGFDEFGDVGAEFGEFFGFVVAGEVADVGGGAGFGDGGVALHEDDVGECGVFLGGVGGFFGEALHDGAHVAHGGAEAVGDLGAIAALTAAAAPPGWAAFLSEDHGSRRQRQDRHANSHLHSEPLSKQILLSLDRILTYLLYQSSPARHSHRDSSLALASFDAERRVFVAITSEHSSKAEVRYRAIAILNVHDGGFPVRASRFFVVHFRRRVSLMRHLTSHLAKMKIHFAVSRAAAVVLATGALVSLAGRANAATIYFDTNGATAGTTNSTAQQTWNTAQVAWSTDPTGSIATTPWVDGSDAVFSAQDPAGVNNAVLAFNVSTGGAKTANSITVQNGTITFLPSATPPTRAIGAGGITLASTANGNVTFSNANGGDTLIINASQPWTDNHATAAINVNCPVKGNAASGTATLTAAANGAGDVLLAGAITDGTAGGNLALSTASTGTGRVNVQGADTYSGGTTVSSGAMLLDNGGSLAHSNITITGGSFAGGTTTNATSGITGGSITDNITNDLGELIALSGTGTLDLTHLNLNVALTGTQTQAEYVLSNADVGSPRITGSAFASTNLPAGWTIDYSGTTANPGDIVLVAGAPAPEPASLGLLGLGAVALIRRRSR